MLEAIGNIWMSNEASRAESTKVIPVNGVINDFGDAIMGRGIALQAKELYPILPSQLGRAIRIGGNHVYHFYGIKVITFPTKHNWRYPSSLILVQRSVAELHTLIVERELFNVVMPRVGCGLGQLDWDTVKPLLETLPDAVTVLDQPDLLP